MAIVSDRAEKKRDAIEWPRTFHTAAAGWTKEQETRVEDKNEYDIVLRVRVASLLGMRPPSFRPCAQRE